MYYIVLLTKMYIHRNKCLNNVPCTKGLVRTIKITEKIEKYNATKENNLKKHWKRWEPLNKIIRCPEVVQEMTPHGSGLAS